MEKLIVRLDFLEFPPVHTRRGGNQSPKITLKGLNAAAFAIIAINPFQPGTCSFSPWVIWNIDPVPAIPPGIPPEKVVTSPVSAI